MTITLEGRIVMSDEQTQGGPRQSAAPAGRRPGVALLLTVLLPTLCLVAGAAWWLHNPPGDGGAAATGQGLPPGSDHDDLFFGWPKPDFALVLSAQMHGYLGPCGCSDPQYGGLE